MVRSLDLGPSHNGYLSWIMSVVIHWCASTGLFAGWSPDLFLVNKSSDPLETFWLKLSTRRLIAFRLLFWVPMLLVSFAHSAVVPLQVLPGANVIMTSLFNFKRCHGNQDHMWIRLQNFTKSDWCTLKWYGASCVDVVYNVERYKWNHWCDEHQYTWVYTCAWL